MELLAIMIIVYALKSAATDLTTAISGHPTSRDLVRMERLKAARESGGPLPSAWWWGMLEDFHQERVATRQAKVAARQAKPDRVPWVERGGARGVVGRRVEAAWERFEDSLEGRARKRETARQAKRASGGTSRPDATVNDSADWDDPFEDSTSPASPAPSASTFTGSTSEQPWLHMSPAALKSYHRWCAARADGVDVPPFEQWKLTDPQFAADAEADLRSAFGFDRTDQAATKAPAPAESPAEAAASARREVERTQQVARDQQLADIQTGIRIGAALSQTTPAPATSTPAAEPVAAVSGTTSEQPLATVTAIRPDNTNTISEGTTMTHPNPTAARVDAELNGVDKASFWAEQQRKDAADMIGDVDMGRATLLAAGVKEEALAELTEIQDLYGQLEAAYGRFGVTLAGHQQVADLARATGNTQGNHEYLAN